MKANLHRLNYVKKLLFRVHRWDIPSKYSGPGVPDFLSVECAWMHNPLLDACHSSFNSGLNKDRQLPF